MRPDWRTDSVSQDGGVNLKIERAGSESERASRCAGAKSDGSVAAERGIDRRDDLGSRLGRARIGLQQLKRWCCRSSGVPIPRTLVGHVAGTQVVRRAVVGYFSDSDVGSSVGVEAAPRVRAAKLFVGAEAPTPQFPPDFERPDCRRLPCSGSSSPQRSRWPKAGTHHIDGARRCRRSASLDRAGCSPACRRTRSLCCSTCR